MLNLTYGEQIVGLTVGGRPVRATVFNENELRAAAGLTLVLGAVAFCYAYLAKVQLPIQAVTTLFFVEFLARVTLGLRFSPVGVAARVLT
jgi:hypothetical protein